MPFHVTFCPVVAGDGGHSASRTRNPCAKASLQLCIPALSLVDSKYCASCLDVAISHAQRAIRCVPKYKYQRNAGPSHTSAVCPRACWACVCVRFLTDLHKRHRPAVKTCGGQDAPDGEVSPVSLLLRSKEAQGSAPMVTEKGGCPKDRRRSSST